MAVAGDPLPGKTWSRDLRMARVGELPEWMVELAAQIKLLPQDLELPRGVIVGSAIIERVSQGDGMYRWHLTGVQRAKKLRKPKGHPQPVWFTPFD